MDQETCEHKYKCEIWDSSLMNICTKCRKAKVIGSLDDKIILQIAIKNSFARIADLESELNLIREII